MISEQDFDQLSAYLDNQLSPKEKLALEARLLVEPELKATLRQLRLQARALRDLPKVKVPRNFTLTAKQAEAIRPPRRSFFETLFPAFRLATSLSATAFVVLLTVSVLNVSMLAPAQTASVSQDAIATQMILESAKEAPLAAGAAPVPQTASGTPEAEALGGGEITMFATTDGSETQVALMPPSVVSDTQNSTSITAADVITNAREAVIAGTPDLAASEPTSATANQVFIPAIGSSAPASEPPPAAPDTTPWLIGLGALTAVLALITWLARRR